MPILATPPPEPPSWWTELTRYEKGIILNRLRRRGYDVNAWPAA